MLHIVALCWAVCVSVATIGVQIHNCLCCDMPAKVVVSTCCHKPETADTTPANCCSEHTGKPCPGHKSELKQLKFAYLQAKQVTFSEYLFEIGQPEARQLFSSQLPEFLAMLHLRKNNNKAPPPRPFGQAMLRFNQVWLI